MKDTNNQSFLERVYKTLDKPCSIPVMGFIYKLFLYTATICLYPIFLLVLFFLSVSSRKERYSKNGRYAKALSYAEKSDYKKAIWELTCLIKEEPNNELYQQKYTELQIKLNQDRYKHMLENMAKMNYKTAYSELECMLKFEPDNLDYKDKFFEAKTAIYASKQLLEEASKENKEKIEIATSLINKNDSSKKEKVISYVQRATIFTQINDFISAINDLNVIIQEYHNEMIETDNQIMCYELRAYSFYVMEKFENAINDYTKIIELSTENKKNEWYINRGECFLKIQNYDSAINDFSMIISCEPLNITALRQRAIAYLAKVEMMINSLSQEEYLHTSKSEKLIFMSEIEQIINFTKIDMEKTDDNDLAQKLRSFSERWLTIKSNINNEQENDDELPKTLDVDTTKGRKVDL